MITNVDSLHDSIHAQKTFYQVFRQSTLVSESASLTHCLEGIQTLSNIVNAELQETLKTGKLTYYPFANQPKQKIVIRKNPVIISARLVVQTNLWSMLHAHTIIVSLYVYFK